MGKITRYIGLFPLLVLLSCLKDPPCSVKPLVEQDMFMRNVSHVDTLNLGEVVWFHSSIALPNLSGRRTIEKTLPYAPTVRLEFYQIGLNIPTDSLIQPVSNEAFTYTTIRPFVLRSVTGGSTYTDHMHAAFNGQLTEKNVEVNWGLEAKKAGLYKIQISNQGISDVLMDHRTEKCPVSWRYIFKFSGDQDISNFSDMYTSLNDMDKRFNYLVYVRE